MRFNPGLLVKTRPQLLSLHSLPSAPSLPWILLPRRRYNDIASWHRPRHVAKAWNRVTTVTRFLWNSYQRTSGLYHQQMYLKQSQKTHQLVGFFMCWFTSNSRLLFVLNYIFPKLSQTKFLRMVFCFDLFIPPQWQCQFVAHFAAGTGICFWVNQWLIGG